MRQGLSCVIAALTILVLAPGAANAALPPFDGVTSFPAIGGPEDPEEYSWEVVLGEEQGLKSLDSQHAAVYYVGDEEHLAIFITASMAHDASGVSVPTSLAVSGGNVLTLTVHHRDGNPDAAGAAFDYPVSEGAGWEGGLTTTIVKGPPDESATTATAVIEPLAAPVGCLVPKLKGKTLASARRRLRRAGCRLGDVTRPQHGSANVRVSRQAEPPGTVLPDDARVGVALAPINSSRRSASTARR
jgi:hypothetical protein